MSKETEITHGKNVADAAIVSLNEKSFRFAADIPGIKHPASDLQLSPISYHS